jgi:hypothetical protein
MYINVCMYIHRCIYIYICIYIYVYIYMYICICIYIYIYIYIHLYTSLLDLSELTAFINVVSMPLEYFSDSLEEDLKVFMFYSFFILLRYFFVIHYYFHWCPLCTYAPPPSLVPMGYRFYDIPVVIN